MKLPTDLSGHELRRILERKGFVFQRQRGSHMILRRAEPATRVVIPSHDSLRPGTLRQILNDAGMTLDELLAML